MNDALQASLKEKISRALRPICVDACRALRAEAAVVVQIGSVLPEKLDVLYSLNFSVNFPDVALDQHLRFLVQRALLHGKAEAIDCLSVGAIHEKIFQSLGYQSICIVPFRSCQHQAGALLVCSKQRIHLDVMQSEVLNLDGKMIVTELENARLSTLLEENRENLKNAHQTLGSIASKQNMMDVIHAVFEQCPKVMDTERCLVALSNPLTGKITHFSTDAISPAYWKNLENLPIPFPSLQRYISDANLDSPSIIPDTGNNTETGWVEQREGHRSLMIFPLRVNGSNIGTLNFYWTELQDFDEVRVALGRIVADQIANAIVNAKRRRTFREEFQQLQSYFQISCELSELADFPALFDGVAAAGAKFFGAGKSALWFMDETCELRCAWKSGISDRYSARVEEGASAYPEVETLTSSKPLLIRDVECLEMTAPRRDIFREEKIRSCFAFPLEKGGTCFGVLSYYFDRPLPLPERTVEKMGHALALRISEVAEKLRLLEKSRKGSLWEGVADSIVRAVGNKLDPEELFRAIVREIRRAVPCDRCAIASLDEETYKGRYWHSESETGSDFDLQSEPEMHAWIVDRIYTHKQMVHIPDLDAAISELPHRFSEFHSMGLCDSLFFPIFQSDRCIAHLAAHRRNPHSFTEDEKRLLASVTEHLGTAISNANHFADAYHRAKRLTVLNTLSRVINENLDLDEVLDRIVRAACDLLQAGLVRLHLRKEGSDELVCRALYSTEPMPGLQENARMGQGITGDVALSGKARLIDDIENVEVKGGMNREVLRGLGLHSILCCPLAYAGESLGVITCYAQGKGVFRQEHLDLLQLLASQALVAIRNAQAHELIQKRVDELECLQEAAKLLASEPQLQDLLSQLSKISSKLLGAARCVMLEESAETGFLTPVYHQGVPLHILELLQKKDYFLAAQETTFKKIPIAISDLWADPRYPYPSVTPYADSFRSAINCPLIYRDHAFGVLVFYWDETKTFSESEVQLAQALADLSATAIQRARLLENIQKTQDILCRVVGHTVDPLVVTDKKRNILLWNAPAERMFGYASADVKGKKLEVIFSEKAKEKIVGVWAGLRLAGGTQTLEATVERGGGTGVPVSTILLPIRNSGGDLEGLTCVFRDLTEQRRAEDALHASEEDFRTIADGSPIPMIVCKLADMRILYVNSQFLRLFDLQRVEAMDRCFWDFIFEWDRSVLMAGRIARGESVSNWEVRVMGPDKSLLWLSVSSHQSDFHGELGVFLSLIDVTDRKRLEQQNESIGYLTHLFINSPDLEPIYFRLPHLLSRRFGFSQVSIAVVDKDSGKLLCMGSTEEGAVGKAVDWPMNRRPGAGREEHSNGGPSPRGLPVVVEAPSSELGEGGGSLFLPLDTGRSLVGALRLRFPETLLISSKDMDTVHVVTNYLAEMIEHQNAEIALKKSEEKFRNFVESAADAIFVYDHYGRIIDANKRAYESMGYSREEFLRLSVKDLDLYFNPTQVLYDWHHLEPGESRLAEGLYRRKNGSTCPVEVSRSKIEWGDRTVVLAFARDITERKEHEGKLKRAMEEAKAASRSKSQFLSTISHELRTPLNLIVGYSDILQMGKHEDAVRETVSEIRDSAEHLRSLIEDLLSMENIEKQNLQLNLAEVSINELVESVLKGRKRSIPSGYALKSEPDASNPRCVCDPARVKQILVNLLDNAIKYSPDGGTILVRTQVQGTEVRVSIRDEGIGIEEEQKEKIFEAFFQADSGDSRRYGGLGIGLNLVRTLLAMQGGRIWVENNEQKGSTFTFSLPRL